MWLCEMKYDLNTYEIDIREVKFERVFGRSVSQGGCRWVYHDTTNMLNQPPERVHIDTEDRSGAMCICVPQRMGVPMDWTHD